MKRVYAKKYMNAFVGSAGCAVVVLDGENIIKAKQYIYHNMSEMSIDLMFFCDMMDDIIQDNKEGYAITYSSKKLKRTGVETILRTAMDGKSELRKRFMDTYKLYEKRCVYMFGTPVTPLERRINRMLTKMSMLACEGLMGDSFTRYVIEHPHLGFNELLARLTFKDDLEKTQEIERAKEVSRAKRMKNRIWIVVRRSYMIDDDIMFATFDREAAYEFADSRNKYFADHRNAIKTFRDVTALFGIERYDARRIDEFDLKKLNWSKEGWLKLCDYTGLGMYDSYSVEEVKIR